MGGAVACRRGRRLVPAALVWAGLSRRARPSFSSGRSLGTALEAGECPGPAARRRRRSGTGSGVAGASGLQTGPGSLRPGRRGRSDDGDTHLGRAAGLRRGGGARRLDSPQLEFLLCARQGRGTSWRPWAYSADGETEAHFGTLDALIPESSPSIPRPQMTVSVFTCKNCGPETGIMTRRGIRVGRDIFEHLQCIWTLLFL